MNKLILVVSFIFLISCCEAPKYCIHKYTIEVSYFDSTKDTINVETPYMKEDYNSRMYLYTLRNVTCLYISPNKAYPTACYVKSFKVLEHKKLYKNE